jgi:hypothetical protein
MVWSLLLQEAEVHTSMPITPPPHPEATPRSVVLIDLDWQEADLVPELLRQAEYHVRLVAGDSEGNAGIRVAELCGVPRTLELADLTREIFDLALVGERSGRRPQLERLLTALGTPVTSPRGFGEGRRTGEQQNGHPTPAIQEPVVHVDLDAALAEALPDLSDEEQAAAPAASPGLEIGEIPGPEEREALAAMLTRWSEATGARSAVLHAGIGNGLGPLTRIGINDPLLDALIQLAAALETPHVVSRIDGDDRGKAWGAWPFRTRGWRGVVAAARVDPTVGRAQWEEAVQALRVAWESGQRARRSDHAGFASPRPAVWLEREPFSTRLSEAVARHLGAGDEFAVYRLSLPDAPAAIDRFFRELPSRLRESDSIARPNLREVLLLHSGAPVSFAHLRQRLAMLWEESWRLSGGKGAAPTISEERADLIASEDAPSFLEAGRRWLRA